MRFSGVYCESSPIAAIRGNTIHDNTATAGGGGGICIKSATICCIDSSLIYNNEALYGGGIFCGGNSSPEIRNCMIYMNSALEGGGYYCVDSTSAIASNTICGNSSEQGGGVRCTWNSTMTLVNTVVWDNDAAEGKQLWIGENSHPSMLSIDYSIVDGGKEEVHLKSGSTLNWGASMLKWEKAVDFVDDDNLDPSKRDYHLTRYSCLINRGKKDGAPTEDIDGDQRPHMGMTDIGADEYVGAHILQSDVYDIQSSAGGKVSFHLDGGLENSGRLYYIIGTKSGSNPGYCFPSQLVLPVNTDWLSLFLLDMILATPYLFPGCGFIGWLDSLGEAEAWLAFFPCTMIDPVRLDFAFAIVQPVDLVSNPVPVSVLP